jgi:hypothetical protein
VSLKALKLSDKQILVGLVPFLEASDQMDIRLLIVRFCPPDQVWTAELGKDLGIPEAGHQQSASSLLFHAQGGRVLGPTTLPGAGLVLSEYCILNS